MFVYVVRRLLLTLPLLFLVTLLSFSLMHLIPGDPATVILGPESTPQDRADLRHKLGLDKPLAEQYAVWMGGLLKGDLGHSLVDNQPITKLIKQRMPATVELAILTLVVSLLVAVPAGIFAATRRGRWEDYVGTTFSLSGLSLPPFWLGLMLILFFAVKLKNFLPAGGYVPFGENLGQNLRFMVLPAVATGLREAAVLMRFLRSSMLEVLKLDYVRTARAKGLQERLVIFRHVVRNALVPVVTAMGLQIAGLLGGLVITETIFTIPGFGSMLVNAIFTRDVPLVQGAVLVAALIVVVVNLVVDLLYGLIDPRIQVATRKGAA